MEEALLKLALDLHRKAADYPSPPAHLAPAFEAAKQELADAFSSLDWSADSARTFISAQMDFEDLLRAMGGSPRLSMWIAATTLATGRAPACEEMSRILDELLLDA
jgi:hypothetical protein